MKERHVYADEMLKWRQLMNRGRRDDVLGNVQELFRVISVVKRILPEWTTYDQVNHGCGNLDKPCCFLNRSVTASALLAQDLHELAVHHTFWRRGKNWHLVVQGSDNACLVKGLIYYG